MNISPEETARILKKWQHILDAGKFIKSDSARLSTALVLENTEVAFNNKDKTIKIPAMERGSLRAQYPDFSTMVEKLPYGAKAIYKNKKEK